MKGVDGCGTGPGDAIKEKVIGCRLGSGIFFWRSAVQLLVGLGLVWVIGLEWAVVDAVVIR